MADPGWFLRCVCVCVCGGRGGGGGGGSIWSNYRTYSMCSERQSWATTVQIQVRRRKYPKLLSQKGVRLNPTNPLWIRPLSRWCFTNKVKDPRRTELMFVIWSCIRIKGSIFLKNRHFIIQERFNKLIYGINTIIQCGTWQPVQF